MSLSPRQIDTLNAIRDYQSEHGFPPTVRELALHLGVSIHAADCHLAALAKKGAINRTPGTARGITIPTRPVTNV